MKQTKSLLWVFIFIIGTMTQLNAQTQAATFEEYIRNAYASTFYILNKSREFSRLTNKKLMVILFDPYGSMQKLLRGEPRTDKVVVDFLNEKAYTYFDMNEVHAQDYKAFNISIEDYYKRYFIGHYNPRGNHFFAYSIKPMIVKWLDPMPFTYQVDGAKSIGFGGYLQGVGGEE